MVIGFKDYHPWVNIAFFISVTVFSMLLMHPVCLVVSFVSALCLDIRIKGRRAAKELFTFLLPMLVFVTVINGLFNHHGSTVLYEMSNGTNITLEAYVYGLVTGLTVINVMLWFFCFNEIVTEDKIMFVLGKRIPKGALVVTMALRFVPLYRRKFSEILQAQKSLGLAGGETDLISKIKTSVRCVSVLITWALENAIETSDSMRARAYGTGKRSFYSRFRFTKSDVLALIMILLFDFTVAACRIMGGLYASYNPQIVINSSVASESAYMIQNTTVYPFSLFEIVALIMYFLLCFLPLTIDVKEELTWHRLKSKI